MAAALGGVLLLCACASFAAEGPKPLYSVIVGTVWTANERPAPGVVIRIRRADKQKAQWELRTDARGEFVQRLPAGGADYIVWAEVKGRLAAEARIHIDDDERQDIGLHLKE